MLKLIKMCVSIVFVVVCCCGGATYFALKTFFIHVTVNIDQIDQTEFSLGKYPKSQIFQISPQSSSFFEPKSNEL